MQVNTGTLVVLFSRFTFSFNSFGKRARKASLRLLAASMLKGESKSASKLFHIILECYIFSIFMQEENLQHGDKNHRGHLCLQMTLWCTVSTTEGAS